MKTQIIRLEPHDDFISARDKMGWSQTGRILLVLPDHGHTLTRKLDLVLLHRHSTSLGAQLALVAKEADVIYQAKKLGIPVFHDVHAAQKAPWRLNRKYRRPRYSPRQALENSKDLESLRKEAHPETPSLFSRPIPRLAIFTLGVLALLSMATVLFPSATITLSPKIQDQELLLTVRSNPTVNSVNLSGAIPSQIVTVEVEGSASTRTSGVLTAPEDYSQGRIKFTNITDRPIQIPAGTVVRSSGNPTVRFATTTDAQVPAGVGESVFVPIQAIEPGTSGNIGQGTLIAIEGESGADLTATNPQATRGGTDQALSMATSTNREQLYEQLKSSLLKTALDEFNSQLNPGDILFTPTITLSQVVDQVYDPPEGLPGDTLNLDMRLAFQAQVASKADIQQLAESALDMNITAIFQAVPGTLIIKTVSAPQMNTDGSVQWRILARRKIVSKIAESQAVNLTLGQSPKLATQRLLTNLPISQIPTIKVIPSWWPRLPILPFRVAVSTAD